MKLIDRCSNCRYLSYDSHAYSDGFIPSYECENEDRYRFNIEDIQINDPDSYGCIHWKEKVNETIERK